MVKLFNRLLLLIVIILLVAGLKGYTLPRIVENQPKITTTNKTVGVPSGTVKTPVPNGQIK